jgi:hypothetical protein
MRSYHHLFLSAYYIVPLVVFVALRIMYDERPAVGGSSFAEEQARSGSRTSWRGLDGISIAVAIIAGGSGVYYAFYAVLFIGASGVYAIVRRRDKRHALVALIFVLVTGSSTLLGMVPVIRYKATHGPNTSVAQRSVGQTDILV